MLCAEMLALQVKTLQWKIPTEIGTLWP